MNDVQAGTDPGARVVTGVDGTPNSLAALRRAAGQAAARGAVQYRVRLARIRD
jgi:hypothetical protein